MAGIADIRVLGPVSVVGPGGPAVFQGARQRTLVALLALNAGQIVTKGRLVDALWGNDPPRTAIRTLHSHVARVRLALAQCGLPDAVLTREPGYGLVGPESYVDAVRFERIVRAAQREFAPDGSPFARATGDAAALAAQLRSGLALWRGMPLTDAEPHGWATAEVERLAELRLVAREELAAAELQLGSAPAVLAELEPLILTHPERERLTGLCMLALQRCGRYPEALARYDALRLRLAESLGADPSPWLRDLHVALLRGAPPGGAAPAGAAPRDEPDRQARPAPRPSTLEIQAARIVVPAQLPAPVGHFVGREPELATLEQWRSASDPGQVVVICGPPGLGKTALATEWAHRLVSRYPDGQVFCDLHGHDPEASLTAGQVLDHVLRAIGVPADRVPPAVAEQRELFRSLTHDRRLLVLLDDAATVDHVLAAVPPTSGSQLVVTSRHRLAGLPAYHQVHTLTLSALGRSSALALLESILGSARLRDEPAAAEDLVERCAGVPLAVRIAAARLAGRPRLSLARLVEEIDGEPGLGALAVEGDVRSVRSVLAGAYRSLSEPAAAVFGALGAHPGPDFTAQLAAAAAGVSVGRARRAVGELATAHLCDETDADRYRFHDLIRRYAVECGGSEPNVVRGRILDWLVGVVGAASRVLDPGRDRVPAPPPPAELPFTADAKSVLSFLDGERSNVVALIESATRSGRPEQAWQASYLVAGYFESRGHVADRIRVFRAGLAAAGFTGDRTAVALMHNGLGIALIGAHRYPEAVDELRIALGLMDQLGDRRGIGHAQNNLGVALMRLRRYPEAIAACERAREVHAANHHTYGELLARLNLGGLHALVGNADAAQVELTAALGAARSAGDRRLESAVLHTSADAHRLAGADEQALPLFEQALALRRDAGIHRYVATTLIDIAQLHLRTGAANLARDRLAEAQALVADLGDRELEVTVLTELGRADQAMGDVAAATAHFDRAAALARSGV